MTTIELDEPAAETLHSDWEGAGGIRWAWAAVAALVGGVLFLVTSPAPPPPVGAVRGTMTITVDVEDMQDGRTRCFLQIGQEPPVVAYTDQRQVCVWDVQVAGLEPMP